MNPWEICDDHQTWCCECEEHPAGKPWGWASRLWAEHWDSTPDCWDNHMSSNPEERHV